MSRPAARVTRVFAEIEEDDDEIMIIQGASAASIPASAAAAAAPTHTACEICHKMIHVATMMGGACAECFEVNRLVLLNNKDMQDAADIWCVQVTHLTRAGVVPTPIVQVYPSYAQAYEGLLLTLDHKLKGSSSFGRTADPNKDHGVCFERPSSGWRFWRAPADRSKESLSIEVLLRCMKRFCGEQPITFSIVKKNINLLPSGGHQEGDKCDSCQFPVMELQETHDGHDMCDLCYKSRASYANMEPFFKGKRMLARRQLAMALTLHTQHDDYHAKQVMQTKQRVHPLMNKQFLSKEERKALYALARTNVTHNGTGFVSAHRSYTPTESAVTYHSYEARARRGDYSPTQEIDDVAPFSGEMGFDLTDFVRRPLPQPAAPTPNPCQGCTLVVGVFAPNPSAASLRLCPRCSHACMSVYDGVARRSEYSNNTEDDKARRERIARVIGSAH